jgi:hypothetical protein
MGEDRGVGQALAQGGLDPFDDIVLSEIVATAAAIESQSSRNRRCWFMPPRRSRSEGLHS